jgi:PKD repeat protein
MNVIVSSGGGFECQADFYFLLDSNDISSVVYFYDNSTPAGLIDSWFWDFGDGTSSTEQNPVHTYPDSGYYAVCLTITADSIACTSTYCDTIMINVGNQYQLGGNVFAGIYQLDHGFAYAYESEGGVITNVYAEMIDTLGYYLFYPLAAADYYLKVEPSPTSTYYGGYMPTYFGDVVTWEDAVLVNLAQTIHTADINLVPMNQAPAGPGQISGSIVHEATLRDGIPAAGVQIMLINEMGEYVGLEYSDENGEFSFTSLPYGTYTLHAEVAGLTMHPEDFTLSEGNEVIGDISMIMSDDEIYFGPSSIEEPEDITLGEIYPNPVTNNIRLELGSKNPTSATLRILNQYGQLLKVQTVDLKQGQSIELNTNDLSSGMYLLEVITKNNFRAVRKFVKLK